jgi:hypothetical protein
MQTMTSTDYQRNAEQGRSEEDNRRDYGAMGSFCRGTATQADLDRLEQRWGVTIIVDADSRGIETAYLFDAQTDAFLGGIVREENTYTNTYRARAANGHEIFARYSKRLHDEIPATFRREAQTR